MINIILFRVGHFMHTPLYICQAVAFFQGGQCQLDSGNVCSPKIMPDIRLLVGHRPLRRQIVKTKFKKAVSPSQKSIVEPAEERRRCSHFRTWSRWHHQLEELKELPVLPLSTVAMERISMAMKSQKYRSTANYLITMKKMHLKQISPGRQH